MNKTPLVPDVVSRVVPAKEASLEVLARRANEAHEEANRAWEEAKLPLAKTAESAVRVGEALLQARAKVGHGKWLVWLNKSCPAIPTQRASEYMRIAKAAQNNELQIPEFGNLRPYQLAAMLPKKPRQPDQPRGTVARFKAAMAKLAAPQSSSSFDGAPYVALAVEVQEALSERMLEHYGSSGHIDRIADVIAEYLEDVDDDDYPAVERCLRTWSEACRLIFES